MNKLCLTCACREKGYPYEFSCDGNELNGSYTFGTIPNTCSMYENKYTWREKKRQEKIEREKPLSYKPFSILKG